MNRFKRLLQRQHATGYLRAGSAFIVLGLALCASPTFAAPMYDDGFGNGCVSCHNEFASGSGALHTTHRTQFDAQSCNLCHPSGGGTTPVLTYSSGAGGGFGCAGCHGQDYGETSPNSGNPKATAYGLRQVHVDNGVTSCGTSGGCHVAGSLGHPNPFPTLFGEDEVPPYFDPIFSNLLDPCSSSDEDLTFDLDSVGLDNDGDGFIDGLDPDCFVAGTPTATPTATSTATPTPVFACGAAPVGGCIAAGKAVVLVNEKKPGKEKVKVVLKKLQSTVVQSGFGNPAAGTTAYKACLYDGADVLQGEYTVDQGGAICGALSCWATVSDKGYKYSDKDLSADGVLKMKLLGGDAGKGKVLMIGKNTNSTLPLGAAAAMQDETGGTIQFLSSDASCVSATLSDVKKADGVIFKGIFKP